MSDVQHIDRISVTDTTRGHPAELTLHYRECFEPSEKVVSIEDVENGDVTFFVATEEETFDVVHNVTIVNLSAENLSLVSYWFSNNSSSGLPLTTQKV
jgi:hypothetical protein